jgi:hypothetical protein
VVNARWNYFDSCWIGSVQLNELRHFRRTVGENRVGTRDDFGLGLNSTLWFCIASFSFDAGKGVERRDQGQRQLVLEAMSDHARQPIVDMNRIGSIGTLQVTSNAVGKLVKNLGKVFLRKVKRASIDMYDSEARLNIDEIGLILG